MPVTAVRNVSSAVVDVTTSPITQGGGVVLTSGGAPLVGNWNAGNFVIQSQNSVGVFNVKAYGALGNSTTGTDGQDDTTFIQAAITAAQVAGGTVEFPVGFYRITSSLVISAAAAAQFGLTLKGEGGSYASPGTYRASTIVWNGAASGKMLSITSSATNQVGDITVTGLCFDGGGAAIGGVAAIYADANTQVNKRLAIDLCHFRRLNRGIWIGDYTNNGNNDYQIDKVTISRCGFYEASDTATSAAMVFDTRNASTCLIFSCEMVSWRFGVNLKRVGFIKLQTVAGGAPNDVMDVVYVDGLHSQIELDQVQGESCNSTVNITANATGGLFNPITFLSCTFNSNIAGTKPSVTVNAAHKITSLGNTYNRPINFASGASQFITWGDLFDSTNFNAAVTVNATNTSVIGTAGTSSLTPATDSQMGLRTTMATFQPPMCFTQVGSGGGTVNATNAYVDVTGATFTFTPPTNCRALITATFDLQQTAAGAGVVWIGTINVNGADQTPTANFGMGVNGYRTMATQNYAVDLTGGTSYTIKQRFKNTDNVTQFTVYGTNTTMNVTLLGRYV